MGSLLCIYCRKRTVEGAFPEAHIFPYSLGGKASSVTTVCGTCNTLVNQRVEQKAVQSCAVFLSAWGIEGRRGSVPRVPATITIDDHEVAVSLADQGEPDRAAVKKVEHSDGRIEYLLFGSLEALEVKKREINEKNPSLRWGRPCRTQLFASVDFPKASDPFIMRLAAKVALEHFADLRGGEAVAGDDFDPLRTFILDGSEPISCCAVVANERWLAGSMNYPVPSHAAHVLAHPADRVVGCFVTLFGLYSYAVVLSRDYPVLAPLDLLLFEYPAHESHRPELRLSGHPRIPWLELMDAYRRDSEGAVAIADRVARTKFGTAIPRD